MLDAEPAWEIDHDDRGTWQVQTGELGKEVDYGVVSDGQGFEDSPDCERIAGGINSKGPRAVAIGRQANMLQWGFYAAPDRMTESAKKAFLNAIVYMTRFDGHAPLVAKASRGRGWYRKYIESVRDLPSMDDGMRASYSKHLRGVFPSDLVERVGLDAERLEEWFAENEEYVRAIEGWTLGIDEDLAELGISNREPGFLDWLVDRLRHEPDDELALKLARRYLGEKVAVDAEAAIAHIDEHRDRMFFSDSGGYRWFVDSRPEPDVR